MSKFLARILATFIFCLSSFACNSGTSSSEVGVLLSDLASSRDMEFVHGDRFPQVNPYGSYGSTFVLDFVEREGVESSVFFLARKKNAFHKNNVIENTTDLIRNYDYFYVYAEKEDKSDSFQVKDVLTQGAGLMGISLYHGWIEIKSKNLVLIESGLKIDSASIDRRKLSTPIVVSSESSTKFLFNYDGKWIQSSEVEP